MTYSNLALAERPERADERISRAVLGLVAQHRTTVEKIATQAGIGRSTMYNRLNHGKPWQADEVDRLAALFGVSRDSLYEGRSEPPIVPGTVADALSARSSTDRASDYGSFVGTRPSAPVRRYGRRRTDAPRPRHLAIVAIAS